MMVVMETAQVYCVEHAQRDIARICSLLHAGATKIVTITGFGQ